MVQFVFFLLRNLQFVFFVRNFDLHLLGNRVCLRDWSVRRFVASKLHGMLLRSSKLTLDLAASELHVELARSNHFLGISVSLRHFECWNKLKVCLLVDGEI